MTTPTLLQEQYQFGDNGVLLNGDFRAGVADRINWSSNPSFEVSLSNWSLNGAATLTRDTTIFYPGNNPQNVSSCLVTCTGATTTVCGAIHLGMTFAEGTKVWLSFWGRIDPSMSQTLTGMRVRFRDDALAAFIVPMQTTIAGGAPLADGVWRQYSLGPVTVPAGNTCNRIYIELTSASTPWTSGFWNIDDLIVETDTPVGYYFDGSTTNTPTQTYVWDGAVGLSMSRLQYPPAVNAIFDLTSIQGLDNAPARQQTAEREGLDGGYVDASYETIRTVTLEGTVFTANGNVDTFLDMLKANFAVSKTNQPLYFQTDAGTRMVRGKSLGFTYPKDAKRRIGQIDGQVQIMCEDPRIYSPDPVSAQINLVPQVSLGRPYPKSFAFGYGSVATEQILQLNILGNRDTPAILHMTGAVINPSIVFDNTGTTFAFATSLAADEYIDIDLGARSVTRNGTQSARGLMTLTGTWPMLKPGINNFRFRGNAGVGGSPLLSAIAWHAWR